MDKQAREPVTVSAPGKLVLWGEYAVLEGAPAAVMAVDRYARVTLVPQHTGWRFQAAGFLTPGVHTARACLVEAPVTALVNNALHVFGHADYATPFSYHADTSAFYRAGEKLGLGSSAAACVATCVALADILQTPVDMPLATRIHQAFQGGKGSGLDIAASWTGGVIRFQQGQVQPAVLPADWVWQVVWSGHAASTTSHVRQFKSWLAANQSTVLHDLKAVSEQLCIEPSLPTLADYISTLAALDRDANLNIFTQEHQRLATIASAAGVVYKPCGAGGGDIGIALSDQPDKLAKFTAALQAEAFIPMQTEIATHGVQIDN